MTRAMRYLLALALLMACGCGRTLNHEVEVRDWGYLPDGRPPTRYTIFVTWDCDSLPDTLKVAIPR